MIAIGKVPIRRMLVWLKGCILFDLYGAARDSGTFLAVCICYRLLCSWCDSSNHARHCSRNYFDLTDTNRAEKSYRASFTYNRPEKPASGSGLCTSNHIKVKHRDVITYPYPNLKGGLVKLLLKLGHGWVITSHIKWCMIDYLYISHVIQWSAAMSEQDRLIVIV